MSQNSTTPNPTSWVMALLISIALNGLLIGLLMSGKMGAKPYVEQEKAPRRAAMMSAYDHPQKLLRHLSNARRKEIMANAMKRTRESGKRHPRELMRELGQARRQTTALLQAPEFDAHAFQERLKQTRKLKEKLGLQGDALVLEIFKQLTPAEREDVGRTRHKDNHKAKQKSKN